VLFDLDGTLTDPKPGITQSVRYALAKFGIPVADLDSLTPFIGPPLLDSFRRTYGFDEGQARRAVSYYREYFAERGLFENAVYPGIPALLGELRSRGTRLIVATSKPTVYAERILRHFDLSAPFEQVCGSDLDLSRSEKAAIIAEILDQLPGVPRDEIVMVGDREHDVLGARANRVAAIGVTYGYGTVAELEAAEPVALATSVAELAALLLA
jgi:phosphoglycolate phosphatase